MNALAECLSTVPKTDVGLSGAMKFMEVRVLFVRCLGLFVSSNLIEVGAVHANSRREGIVCEGTVNLPTSSCCVCLGRKNLLCPLATSYEPRLYVVLATGAYLP